MALASALVAERKHHTSRRAYPCYLVGFTNPVGDRLVEKYVLAGLGRHSGGFEVHVVGRRVDDRFDVWILEDRVIAQGWNAAVFFRKCAALVFGPRKTRSDLKL